MAERYDDWERRRWRDVDEESDHYYRRGQGRDYQQMRNDTYGTGYQGSPQRRRYGWESGVDAGPRGRFRRGDYRDTDYNRSDFARSDRPQQYGRNDFGREPYREPIEGGDYARSDRPDQYGRGDYDRRQFAEPYQQGDYGRGDYAQGELRGRPRRRYGPRRRRIREPRQPREPREPYEARGEQRYNEPTTWSYTEYWMMPGPHTGTGPSGYQRSDERITEDVCERMTRHGYLDAGNIEVDADEGIVILKGTVDSRRTKRMAEDTAESVSGVWDIDNRLTVRRGEEEREQVETPQT